MGRKTSLSRATGAGSPMAVLSAHVRKRMTKPVRRDVGYPRGGRLMLEGGAGYRAIGMNRTAESAGSGAR